MSTTESLRAITRYHALALPALFGQFFPYVVFLYDDGSESTKCLDEHLYDNEQDAIAEAIRYARDAVARQIDN